MRSSWLAIFIAIVCISLSGVPIHAQKACFLTLLPAERLRLIDEVIKYDSWRGGIPEWRLAQLGYTVVSKDPSGRTVTFLNPYTGSKLEFPTREGGQISINIVLHDKELKDALETNGNFRHIFYEHALAEGTGEFRFTEHAMSERAYFLNEPALINEAGFRITYEFDNTKQDGTRTVRYTRFRDGAEIWLFFWNRVELFDFGIQERRKLEAVIQNGGNYKGPEFFPVPERPQLPNDYQPRPGVVLSEPPKRSDRWPQILPSNEPERPVNTPKIIP